MIGGAGWLIGGAGWVIGGAGWVTGGTGWVTGGANTSFQAHSVPACVISAEAVFHVSC